MLRNQNRETEFPPESFKEFGYGHVMILQKKLRLGTDKHIPGILNDMANQLADRKISILGHVELLRYTGPSALAPETLVGMVGLVPEGTDQNIRQSYRDELRYSEGSNNGISIRAEYVLPDSTTSLFLDGLSDKATHPFLIFIEDSMQQLGTTDISISAHVNCGASVVCSAVKRSPT